MHVNRGLLGWGLFFIVLGAVPLAVRAGVIDADRAAQAWQLWPLLLIGAGVGLVLARTRASMVGGVIVAVTGGLMLGGLLAAGLENGGRFPFGACTGGDGGTPFAEQRGTFGPSASVNVELDCGEVTLAAAPGSGWTVSGTSEDGRPPDVTASPDRLFVRDENADGSVNVGADALRGGRWEVALPQEPLTTLELAVNAGSAEAALDGMRLERVGVDVNAGSVVLDLGEAREAARINVTVNAGSAAIVFPALSLRGSLAANAGSLELCVPDGVDLRISLDDNALGSDNFAEAGLRETAGRWVTPDPPPGAPVIELDASANLGSITLNPDDGCE
ncbi:MAG TPA: hypothetical protein VFY23_01380 [Candidatus Limnocylindrales bacterium]|nr:hypothetical protein [Candidatus Limnocylindrales bacterium]